MADPRELRDEFAAAFEEGSDPDPRDYLERAGEGQRQETAALIDRYLMTAPRRAWDPDAYEKSLAKAAADQVYESLEGVSGSWPELLPALRKRARIKRRALVERLTAALGFGGEPQIDKVGRYYHGMEHGLVPAEGVSASVIDALATILGVEPERIRRAGSSGKGLTGGPETVFARTAVLDADYAVPPAPPAAASQRAREERDEIDELFTAG